MLSWIHQALKNSNNGIMLNPREMSEGLEGESSSSWSWSPLRPENRQQEQKKQLEEQVKEPRSLPPSP